MNNETVLGTIIMVLCCWGSAAVFTGIGIHARKRNTPINFWAGVEVDPTSVRDIAGYNQENSNLWLFYSVPYWISGAVSFFFGAGDWVVALAVMFLVLACFPGIPMLIQQYRKIEKKYLNVNCLDKMDPFC